MTVALGYRNKYDPGPDRRKPTNPFFKQATGATAPMRPLAQRPRRWEAKGGRVAPSRAQQVGADGVFAAFGGAGGLFSS